MFCDNSTALLIANESRVQRGAIHYHRRYYYVRECIEIGEINPLKVYTDDNLADPYNELPSADVGQSAAMYCGSGIGIVRVRNSKGSDWKFDGVSIYFPNALRCLKWHGYSFTSLPNTFQGKNLVGLEMYKSNIVRLWEDGEEKVLNNLRLLRIRSSKLRTFDLRFAPNLERLTISTCYDFVEIHMPVESVKLRYLDVTHSKLKTLHLGRTPNLKHLTLEEFEDHWNTPNLQILILVGCNDLVELEMPIESTRLECLVLSHIQQLKTIHLGTPNLKELILEECNDLVEFQKPVESFELEELNLNHSKLRILDLGLTPNLKRLNLEICYGLVDINAPVGCLRNLAYLDLSGCGIFKSFLFDKHLNSHEVGSLSELHLIAEPTDVCPLHSDNDSPKFQFSCYYKEDPDSSFGNLERLIYIGLCACTNLQSFSRSICSLQCIRKLTLEGSITEAPRDLDQLECLEELIFSSTKIRNLPDTICKMKHLKSFKLKSCLLFKKLPDDLGRT
ncbi:Toll/interleukin-1 receptor domain-containing protein [Tanacetum coccineum]